MSVWKKASKANQKVHRERHQPEERKHLGILEKKKDYTKRASDYNEKQETIRVLRKRALNRNPDEFYHHMINSKVAGGVHHEKSKAETHTPEQTKLMETQDVRYVNMKRTLEMKKIERLQSQLHLIDVDNKPKNTHKRFFDTKEEEREFTKKRKPTKPTKEFGYSVEKLSEKPLKMMNPDLVADLTKKRESSYAELSDRIKREHELSVVQQKMEIKRHLQTRKNCLPPRREKPGTPGAPCVYKWRSQRKR